MPFADFVHRPSIEDLATRDNNVISVPVALPTGYVVNRPTQVIGDRVDVNKDGPSKEVRMYHVYYLYSYRIDMSLIKIKK